MAREFVKINEWETWIPDLDGERQLYEDAPEEALTMELRFLTKEQRDHYQRLAEKHKRRGETSTADIAAMRQMFKDNVRNVKNYIADGVPVTTGEQLFDVNGDTRLILAVTSALMERSSLETGLAKKLRTGSAFSASRQKRNGNGAVRDAIPASTTTTPVGSDTMIPSYDYQTPSSENSVDAIAKQVASSTTGPGTAT